MRNIKIIIFITIIIIFFIFILHFLIKENTKASQMPNMEALRSFPYLNWSLDTQNIQKFNVTKYDQKKSFKGINIYKSNKYLKTHLIDMTGNILHTWSTPNIYEKPWHHVEVCKNGDLLGIVCFVMLIRLDWNSNIKWISLLPYHHDISIAENGDIYSLITEEEIIPQIDPENKLTNDYLIILRSDGKVKKKISIAKIVLNSKISAHHIKKMSDKNWVFHANTVEIIKKDMIYNSKILFKKGDILICIRELNLVAVVDIGGEKIVWKWGTDILSLPHDPTLLENGNILIFDNGVNRGYSRIIELSPLNKEIVWEYKSNPPDQFFTISQGSSQRLPNGNTLITESKKGHVFEVTKSGEIVWEFYNPERKEEEKRRATLYRMMRIFNIEHYHFLKELM